MNTVATSLTLFVSLCLSLSLFDALRAAPRRHYRDRVLQQGGTSEWLYLIKWFIYTGTGELNWGQYDVVTCMECNHHSSTSTCTIDTMDWSVGISHMDTSHMDTMDWSVGVSHTLITKTMSLIPLSSPFFPLSSLCLPPSSPFFPLFPTGMFRNRPSRWEP